MIKIIIVLFQPHLDHIYLVFTFITNNVNYNKIIFFKTKTIIDTEYMKSIYAHSNIHYNILGFLYFRHNIIITVHTSILYNKLQTFF